MLAKELVKILIDGKWYNTSQLVILAGKFIRPEVAFRHGVSGNNHRSQSGYIYKGQQSLIRARLNNWRKSNKLDHRLNGQGRAEWRITDWDWANNYLREKK